jgi:5'-nucleotidase (lipoprotein e(P4) family)
VRTVLPLLLVALGACASTAPTTEPATPGSAAGVTAEPPSAANAAARHREVHWFRTAAEYRALAVQVFRDAGEAVRDGVRDREPGSWAVIMDADETILDNSEFERRIAESGVEFEESMWSDWVREEAAGLVPGAAGFIALVHELGGRVAIVTNRDEELCPATWSNLAALGVRPAALLCETETGEKEPRFRMVREGTAAEGLPPLEVVAWIGDNIGDFPDATQALRDAPDPALDLFGRRYFVLPNPMYGSWMGNDWK